MSSKSVAPSKKCLLCGEVYFRPEYTTPSNWKTRKFCSITCGHNSKKEVPTWNTGMKINRKKYPKMGHFGKRTETEIIKITRGLDNWKKSKTKEELSKLYASFSWKENATYNSIHRWIQKHWIKTGKCQKCGIEPVPKGRLKYATQWHNIDHEYDRNNKDTWIELCPKCHKREDILWQIQGSTT